MTAFDKKEICKILIASIAFTQFIKPFIALDLSKITFLLGIFLFFCSIFIIQKSFRKTAIIFFTMGMLMLLFVSKPIATLIAGTNSMLNIVAILVVMQLFTVPIKTGNYNKSIEYFLYHNIKSQSSLYLFTMGITHVFSSFLLFGTIPVMLSLMESTIKEKVSNYKQFISTAISRSYGLVVLWAPGAVNVLLVLQATQTKWADIFLPGLFLSILGLSTSFLLERKYNLQVLDQGSSYNENITPKEAKNKTTHIILVVLSLVLINFLLERINFASSTSRIMIAGISVVAIWCLKYITNKNVKTYFFEYWNNEVPKNLDLSALFIAIGIFAEAVGNIGVIDILKEFLNTHGNYFSAYILFLIPLAIVLCSIIGIHPFISLVMVGKILTSLTLPFSNVSIALSLSIGGTVSYIVSPFAGIVLTLSKFIDCDPRQISLKWNGLFSIVYFIEATILIYIYNLFIN